MNNSRGNNQGVVNIQLPFSKHTVALLLLYEQCYEDVRGSGEIAQFLIFGERSASLPGCFPPGERGPGPHRTGCCLYPRHKGK